MEKNGNVPETAKIVDPASKQDLEGFVTAINCRYPWFCVGVKRSEDGVQVRDTKDPGKKTLSFTKDEWAAFVQGVKNGEFDA